MIKQLIAIILSVLMIVSLTLTILDKISLLWFLVIALLIWLITKKYFK